MSTPTKAPFLIIKKDCSASSSSQQQCCWKVKLDDEDVTCNAEEQDQCTQISLHSTTDDDRDYYQSLTLHSQIRQGLHFEPLLRLLIFELDAFTKAIALSTPQTSAAFFALRRLKRRIPRLEVLQTRSISVFVPKTKYYQNSSFESNSVLKYETLEVILKQFSASIFCPRVSSSRHSCCGSYHDIFSPSFSSTSHAKPLCDQCGMQTYGVDSTALDYCCCTTKRQLLSHEELLFRLAEGKRQRLYQSSQQPAGCSMQTLTRFTE